MFKPKMQFNFEKKLATTLLPMTSQ